MTDAWIGLDVGTTAIKAVAVDVDDRELAAASRPTPTTIVPTGGEYDADELWRVAAETLSQVTDALVGGDHIVGGVATSSMGEAGVLVDGRGQPTAPAIAWFDQRTVGEATWWHEHVGSTVTHSICALPIDPIFSAPKMLWMKRHWPESWVAGRHWLNIADWMAFRLSGVMATDYTLASRTMLFDLAARRWSDELVEASGIEADRLGPLIQSGEVVGRVDRAAADATGLPVGTIVGAGGQDHICAAGALGVVEPGMLLDSIGTAEAFLLVLDGIDHSGALAEAGLSQGAHVVPNRNYVLGALSDGGGRIDRCRDELGLDWEPFLETPAAAAVIEELAVDGARVIHALEVTARHDILRHLVTGGGSRNAQLIERKRAIGGRSIEIAAHAEAAALGAAHLARGATG